MSGHHHRFGARRASPVTLLAAAVLMTACSGSQDASGASIQARASCESVIHAGELVADTSGQVQGGRIDQYLQAALTQADAARKLSSQWRTYDGSLHSLVGALRSGRNASPADGNAVASACQSLGVEPHTAQQTPTS